MAAERDRRRAQGLAGHARDELLHPAHRVLVVRVGLVPLEHRELRVVLVGDALVAKILAQLVDALEPADDEALEVELGRDPQVEVGAELVRVRDERPGESAAVARLQHRRLDLDEPLVVEGAAHRGDHAGAEHEVIARLLVHEQIEIAAAVALLDVGEPVEGVGERCADPREQLERVDRERRLAAPRLGRTADRTDDVAEVHVDLSRPVDRAEKLDAAGAVDEVEERQLSHVAAREDAAGEAALGLSLATVLERVGLGPDGGDLVPVGEALWQVVHGASLVPRTSGDDASSTPAGRRRGCGPCGRPRSPGARRRRCSPRCS